MGSVLMTQPLTLTMFTLWAILLAICCVAFAAWGTFTRKEHVTGRIALKQPVSKIYAPAVGTVLRKFVNEGEPVKKGQVLFLISTERATKRENIQSSISEELLNNKKRLIAELSTQQRISSEEQIALESKLRDLNRQLDILREEIATQVQRVALSESTLSRFHDLSASKFVSAAQVNDREKEKLDQDSRLQTLRRNEVAIRADIESTSSALRNAPRLAQNRLSEIQRQISANEQEYFENEARREIAIRAVQDGQATAVLSEVGQTITPSTPMMSLLPVIKDFEAILYVPSRAIGLMRNGDKVQLRYEAFPYQKFGQYGGSIKSISRTALTPSELQTMSNEAETLYRVIVHIDKQKITAFGSEFELQDGMRLEADILLETRKLYEWMLEPIYTVKGKI